MQINLKIDTKKLEEYLSRIGSEREISSAVREALQKIAIQLRKDLIEWTPQDTRDLLNSYEIQWKGKMSIEAGYNIVYAMYQEMGMRRDGTHIIRNRPAGGKTHYFKETVEDNTKKYLDMFEDILWNELLS